MFIDGADGLFDKTWNICVIGAGPVGITIALELARRGQHVLLLESGVMGADPDIQELSAATLIDPRSHADLSVAVQRSFGGTSNLWGAGCIPLDPVDFEHRPAVTDASWPIGYADFAAYLPEACAYANCGAPQFRQAIDGLPEAASGFETDCIVRYSRTPSFGRAYESDIRTSEGIKVHLGVTVTEMLFSEDGRVEFLAVVDRGGQRGSVKAGRFVVACGGVETARLLLSTTIDAPLRFGGEGGPLGRGYMGHLSGEIADIRLSSDALDRGLDFFLPDSAYARRRLVATREVQLREGLTNVSFWPVPPEFGDAAHRDAVLSLAYLVLTVPALGRIVVSEAIRQLTVNKREVVRLPHVMNLARGLPAVAGFLPWFLYRRLVANPRLPGLHLRNPARRYALHYHGEHLPNPESRIRLGSDLDRTGARRAVIDLKYSRADAEPIVRTHRMIAAWLQKKGFGELIFRVREEEQEDYVLAHAFDGVHQIGTTRMANSPREGVVDSDCRVFGSPNLYVAGSAVFPTSGQANPTLSAIALGVRLARHLASSAA